MAISLVALEIVSMALNVAMYQDVKNHKCEQQSAVVENHQEVGQKTRLNNDLPTGPEDDAGVIDDDESTD